MWADVKKHNMSNVVVRNGGGWKPPLLNDANIVHAVKSVTNKKLILEISDAVFLGFLGVDDLFACRLRLLCIANVLHLSGKCTTVAMQNDHS